MYRKYGILKMQEQFLRYVQEVRYLKNAGAVFKVGTGRTARMDSLLRFFNKNRQEQF